ncbi:MOSC N-terminal beta barrel domain-containing protein [Halobacteria archaeon AArc-m2/3/4]|uniref:MOSC N-terminal beta barrel domain-containing protein n=1 Tax=Natronoglomus mannanivorans TaxID=2979990 RepID=A0ABT2Q8J9_9EURY|nr:MOSC N-terminal beta barrel domain-containing protein [Halobacteria archaeon AArc-m2/3/4]
MTTPTRHLERILVHPIKSLDATSRETARIVDNGGLEWDRRYAIVDADGEYVNGKREQRIHRLRARFDLERETVALREHGDGDGHEAENGREEENDDGQTFHLEDDRAALAAWLSAFVGYDVDLVRDDEGGFPDDTDASGPTVISRGTLEAVASWYDGISPTEMRRRLRPNLVVGSGSETTAFWEDRLYEAPGRVVAFEVGGTELLGVNPCQRCVVPTRDPDTGEVTNGFRERFCKRREATLPEWASQDWFDHYFRLMVNTHVPEASWGARLAVGDAVSVGDTRDDPTV